MQTPKARNGSLEVPHRTSSSTSQKSSSSTNRTARQLKVGGRDSDSIAPPNPSSRTPKKSPNVLERGSPRSPMTEKRPAKLSELENQLAQLQDELKRSKDQLFSSESLKRQAQQEAEDTKKQLAATSARLENSQLQLVELSATEDARVQELRKLSLDRDRAWQSELEAVQNQCSMDSTALTTARNEIQKLRRQLEMLAKSEAEHIMHLETAYTESQSLRAELDEALSLVDRLKKKLNDCKGSEAHALETAREAKAQLEAAMINAESLRSEGLRKMETYHNLASDLQQSKDRVGLLENLVSKLQGDLESRANEPSDASEEIIGHEDDDVKKEDANKLKAEMESLKVEIAQLKSALEASELRYQEEYIQSTLQIRNAYDHVELARSEASVREAEVGAELKKAADTVEELKSELISTEAMLQTSSGKNTELNIIIEENESIVKKSKLELELKKLKEDLQDLKVVLLDKEMKFLTTIEENEMLKTAICKQETERSKTNEEATALAEAAKAAEREALMKLGYANEEADKSSRKAARVAEQLEATQTANSELEAELRRLKVQSDQWRKAAEAAAAMLSSGKDRKFMDRTVSLDGTYNTLAAKMDSPLSDDMDDDSPKKKNGNMLKKIGVLWKKGQK